MSAQALIGTARVGATQDFLIRAGMRPKLWPSSLVVPSSPDERLSVGLCCSLQLIRDSIATLISGDHLQHQLPLSPLPSLAVARPIGYP